MMMQLNTMDRCRKMPHTRGYTRTERFFPQRPKRCFDTDQRVKMHRFQRGTEHASHFGHATGKGGGVVLCCDVMSVKDKFLANFRCPRCPRLELSIMKSSKKTTSHHVVRASSEDIRRDTDPFISALQRLDIEADVDSDQEAYEEEHKHAFRVVEGSMVVIDNGSEWIESDVIEDSMMPPPSTGPEDPVEFDEEIRANKLALLRDENVGTGAFPTKRTGYTPTSTTNDLETSVGTPDTEEQTQTSRIKSRRRSRGQSKEYSNTSDYEPHIPDEVLPRVVVVGRPNVGKSALFNRLIGKQIAIVYDEPGVTRDRLSGRASWGGRDFMMVDTGGLTSRASGLSSQHHEEEITLNSLAETEGLPAAVERQAAAAVAEASVLILVVDGRSGLMTSDEEVIDWLRRCHPVIPLILAVNKCDNVSKADEFIAEFWSTGLEPIAISALGGSGTGDLLDKVVSVLPSSASIETQNMGITSSSTAEDEGSEKREISVAIVGRPNVGKSSLLNALVGEERSIVSSISGTTRDAVDTDIELPNGEKFLLIDTAGVRRRAAIASSRDGAEPLSVERAFRAVRRAEVVVLVVDAVEGITQQDFRLAEYISMEGRACVVAINKWDAIQGKTSSTLADTELNVRAELRPVEWANIVFTSAKTGQRVARIFDAVRAAAEEHRRRITTATLNLVIQDATGWRQPPTSGSGRKGRIYYGTQTGIKPPTFVMFCNEPKLFSTDYQKYMERQFRENVGFMGTPLRLYWRGKG